MSEIIKYSDYKSSHAWHGGRVIATSEIPYYLREGAGEGEGFFAVMEDCITRIARGWDAGDCIESILDLVSSEIQDGADLFDWNEGEGAAKTELQALLDAWSEKHMKPHPIYWETSTRIDVSELRSLDDIIGDYGRASQAFDAKVLQSFIDGYPQHADALRRYAHAQLTFATATNEEIEQEHGAQETTK